MSVYVCGKRWSRGGEVSVYISGDGAADLWIGMVR